MTTKWEEPEEVHVSFVLLQQEKENIRLAPLYYECVVNFLEYAKEVKIFIILKGKKTQNVKQVRQQLSKPVFREMLWHIITKDKE